MSDSIFSRIADMIAQTAGIQVEKILPDSKFQDLGMDSLDSLSLISDLEQEFNVKIPNQELLKIKTVGQAVESLEKRMAGVN